MLKKRLGLEVIEIDKMNLRYYYIIPLTLIIPEGCVRIGNWVFSECEVEKVVISESVKSIGTGSFDSCISLREVVISGSVEKIGSCAFNGCWWLKKVVIPGSVKKIGEFAFGGCEEATIIIMDKSSESDFKFFGKRAFKDCKEVSYVKEEART